MGAATNHGGTPFGFLSDTRRAPAGRAAALCTVRELLGSGEPEELYRACNLLALLHFRSGSAAEARRLCLDQIAYARARHGTPLGPRFTVLALQPQVNLIRLRGYTPALADEALRDLAALEPLVAGRGVVLPDLTYDTVTVRRLTEDGLLDRSVVRNIVVQDTLQILWRHRQYDRLLAAATRFRALWPDIPRERTVQHADEAPWLVDARTQPVLTPAALDHATSPTAARLTYVRLLHIAADSAHADDTTGRDRARTLVTALAARRTSLDGAFASTVTPLRWLGHLALTATRAALPDIARTLVGELAAQRATADDPVLDGVVRARLGRPPRVVPPDERAPVPGDLTDAVRERLAADTPAAV
ncbi:hypothetical protein [Streptomyces avicenniae]|uniref:hypothetical protein n=1 Tax=Streptomyces avicenniae TaxID=500153 RepID=UPI00069976B4|nr:hypothetical protein [Streptomyces avicenniae]